MVAQKRLIATYIACLVSGHIVPLRHIQTTVAVFKESQSERTNFHVFVCGPSDVSP